MLAKNIPIPDPTPVLREVSQQDILYAEMSALPDAPSRRRPSRIAKKLEKRQDFATFATYRRALEIFEQLES